MTMVSLRLVDNFRIDWVTANKSSSGADISPDAESERSAHLAVLLSDCGLGNTRAFEDFYDETIGLASALVQRIVGPNYAEDVLSDAYFQAWRDVARFDARRGSPISWLLTIVRSRALDRLRAEQLRHAGLEGAPEFNEDDLEDEAQPGPDCVLEHTQTHSRLHQALASLSAQERWVHKKSQSSQGSTGFLLIQQIGRDT